MRTKRRLTSHLGENGRLKSAVIKSDRYERVINEIFQDMAEHY